MFQTIKCNGDCFGCSLSSSRNMEKNLDEFAFEENGLDESDNSMYRVFRQ